MVEPRPSASVILVRDAHDGLETFMLRRHARSPVAPSAYVFPGGTVRDDDLAYRCSVLTAQLSERSDSPIDDTQACAYYLCAIRELFEEAGVLLVRDSSGALLCVDSSDVVAEERLGSTRLGLQSRQLAIDRVLADNGWRPAFDLLIPFSHWVTPRALAARFDTRFFVAVLPDGQSALHDTIETSEGVWLAPSKALEGDYHVVFATAQHLRRLVPFQQVADLLAFARGKPIRRVMPELVEGGDSVRVVIDPEIVDQW